MFDIQKVTDKVWELVETHKHTPHIEFEFRLGRHNGKFFDTNVGKEKWDGIMAGLVQYNGWENDYLTMTDCYYNDAEKIRLSVDANTGQQTTVKKQLVTNEDFLEPSTVLDLRCGVSVETPVDGQYEMDRKVSKQRRSFVRKNLQIDMTMVSGVCQDLDAEDPYVYQIELEICRPDLVETPEEIYNMCHKVNDVLKIISS
jgi:hypothetical protein